MKAIIAKSYLLFWLLLIPCRAPSREQAPELITGSDTAAAAQDQQSRISSVYAGAGWGSDMVYLGTSLSNNNPFYAASLTYGFKNTLFATASTTHLPEFSHFSAFSAYSINYSHAFNDWFDLSASGSWYTTAKALKDTLFSDFFYLNATAGFDWKLLYTRVSFSEILSLGNGFYMQVSNSHYFDLPVFRNKKLTLSADPSADLLLGTILSSTGSGGGKRYGYRSPFSTSRVNSSGGLEKYSEKFGLIDINFTLPVTFSAGRFSIEAEPSYLLPLHSDLLVTENPGFTFYLNIFYKIL